MDQQVPAANLSTADNAADQPLSQQVEVDNSNHVPHDMAAEVSNTLPDEQPKPGMSLYELVRTDFIRCTQCTEVYTYPCILPCLHSFCGTCIDKLQQGEDRGMSFRFVTGIKQITFLLQMQYRALSIH